MNLELHPELETLWIVSCDENISEVSQVGEYLKKYSEIINDGIKKGMSFYFKGFPVKTVKEFEQVLKQLNPNFLPYTGAKVRLESETSEVLYSPRSTPRYLKNYLHNEMAYQSTVPPIITLYCEQAGIGGESLVGDQRLVWKSIRADYREKLEKKKLKFVRSLVNQSKLHDYLTTKFDSLALFPSWQSNFKTNDKSEVEKQLADQGFEVEWSKKGDLSFSCIIDPCKEHPVTKEKMWVNNGHLFQLHPKVYGRFLNTVFKFFLSLSSRPMTVCLYGDGEPIESEVISNILDATEENEIEVSLTNGDFLYANNYVTSHGRNTFSGERRLYFGLLNNTEG